MKSPTPWSSAPDVPRTTPLVHMKGAPEQRRDVRLLGGGIGIHQPRLDEDLSVRGVLFPHPEGAQRVS